MTLYVQTFSRLVAADLTTVLRMSCSVTGMNPYTEDSGQEATMATV